MSESTVLMENLKKCNNDCCNPPALKPNDLNTDTPSNDCAPTWIPNFAYITQADLYNLYGFFPDADLNPQDTNKTNQVTMAIAYASERINTLTGNKIEGVGFNNLNLTQQNLVQRATAKLTIYYLRDGMEFIRASVSYSGNGVAVSSSPPSDPDYVPDDVYNLLQQANLYKVRQGHSINYCQRCNQNCNNTCTNNQIWRNDPGEQFVRWQNANMAFLRAPYVTSNGGTISITNTSTPTNAGINIEASDELSPILERLILGSNANTIAYAVTPTTFMGNDLITQTWLLSQLEPFQPVLQFTNPLLLTGNTVSFKIDTTGNIGLTVTSNGLKTNITTDTSLNFPSAGVLSALPLVTTNTFTINGTSQAIINAITLAQQVGATNTTNITSINGIIGVLGTDVTNLKAHPILNSPTNEPILVEISDNTKLNVNHNLMFDGSGSPVTSPIDPADTDGRSYATIAWIMANYATTTGLDGKQIRFGTSTGWDSNCFQNSVGGNVYVKALTKAGISSYITYDQINTAITTLPTKQNLLTSSNAGQFIDIDVTVPTIPVISVKESQLSNQIIGIDTYAYSIGTTTTFNAIQSANANIDTLTTHVNTNTDAIGIIVTTTNTLVTNVAKGFYWKPITINQVNTRTVTVASGSLVVGQTYRVGYNLNTNYSTSVSIVFKEFQFRGSGMQLDQLITFTLLVVGNVTTLQTNGITITITSNSGTLGFITSLDQKEPLTN